MFLTILDIDFDFGFKSCPQSCSLVLEMISRTCRNICKGCLSSKISVLLCSSHKNRDLSDTKTI